MNLRVESARTGLPTFFGRTYSQPLFLMQGLVAIVLLLCAVNVGGLMMSQVHARRHEFAVRTAIGAARWRLVRQHLTESCVIALLGAALGAAMAWHGTTLLQRFFRDPMWFEGLSLTPDRAVFAITGVFAVLTTLLFGVVPAWRAGRTDPGMLLKTRGATGGRRRIAGRAFVPVQVALSLVLVAVATLMAQSLLRLRGEPTGFDLRHVTIQTPPFNLLPQRGDARLDVYQHMVDRLEQLPGMQSAAVTWYTPMTGGQADGTFQPLVDRPQDYKLAFNQVGPGYFRTMKTAILAGREFERNERQTDVCVLNQSAAGSLFPHQQPLGRYVRSADPKQFPEPVTCRVVGVAEDAKFGRLREPPPRTIYFPITAARLQDAGNLVFLMNSGTKAQAIAAYRQALKEIAPSIPLVLFATLEEQMNAALGSESALALMSAVFGGMALFLSALGLYGLLSSSVTQRTGEIGVRIALGAQRGTVLRMILEDAFRLLAVGVALGGVGLALLVGFVRRLLYGISAYDPVSLGATAALLALVTLAAAALPALRAAAVDPAETLRAE
jgi:predicted permease